MLPFLGRAKIKAAYIPSVMMKMHLGGASKIKIHGQYHEKMGERTRGQFFSLHLRVIALWWLHVSSFAN